MTNCFFSLHIFVILHYLLDRFHVNKIADNKLKEGGA